MLTYKEKLSVWLSALAAEGFEPEKITKDFIFLSYNCHEDPLKAIGDMLDEARMGIRQLLVY